MIQSNKGGHLWANMLHIKAVDNIHWTYIYELALTKYIQEWENLHRQKEKLHVGRNKLVIENYFKVK